MKPQHLILAAAVPAAAFLTLGGNAGAKGARSLHVTMHQTAVKIADAPPAGDSPADLGVVSGELRAPGTTRVIGHYQGYCVQVAPATGNSECTFTLKLPHGQVDILGGYGKGISAGDVVHEAVVGGTGAYRGVRGQTTGVEHGDTIDVRIALDR